MLSCGVRLFTLFQCTHCRKNKNDFAVIKSSGRQKGRAELWSRFCPAYLQQGKTGHETEKRFRYLTKSIS